MEPILDLDMEVNDVEDYAKSEKCENKNDFTDKKLKHLNSDDLAMRYKHIEEFFLFESSETKENGITDMKFSCVNCAQHGQGRKVLKTSSQAPMSNLKKHLNLKHTNSMGRFLAILESIPRKSRLKNQTIVKREGFLGKSTKDFDFVAKYAHLEEFFKFESSKGRDNGIFDMEFSCTKCLPVVKVLKTSTQAPMSNLRAHLKKVHANFMNQFDEITQLAKSYKIRKQNKKSIEKNIDQSNEDVFFEEEQEELYVSHNPWIVNSIYDFSYFCCPECEDSKWKLKQDFVNHALSTHPNSIDPIHHEIIDGSLNDIILPDVTSAMVDFKV